MSINRGTDSKNVAYITMGFYSAVEKNEKFRKMDRSRQYNINKVILTQNKQTNSFSSHVKPIL